MTNLGHGDITYQLTAVSKQLKRIADVLGFLTGVVIGLGLGYIIL